MSIRAIIFGATGMVGEGVLHEALKDDTVESILVVGRRTCGVSHTKLSEIIHEDFYNYTAIQVRFRGYNACFFCLGVTSIGKNEAEYHRLTYDLTLSAAQSLVQVNPEMVFCYVSGEGTDSTERGNRMWARVKGKTENDLMKLPFKAVYAFRPGYIKPTKGLKNTLSFSKWIAPMYPLMKMFLLSHICTLEDIGRSMIRVVERKYPNKILENAGITQLGQSR